MEFVLFKFAATPRTSFQDGLVLFRPPDYEVMIFIHLPYFTSANESCKGVSYRRVAVCRRLDILSPRVVRFDMLTAM